MNTEVLSACDRIVSAAINSTYQGIIIVVLVGLGLKLLARTNAATRHAVWLATLALVVSMIPAHCFRDYFAGAPRPSAARDRSERVDATPERAPLTPAIQSGVDAPASATLARRAEPLASLGASASPPLPDTHFFDRNGASIPTPAPVEPASARRIEPADEPQDAFGAPEKTVKARSHWPAARLVKPISCNIWSGSQVPRIASFVLLAVWIGVATLRATVLVWRLGQLQKLKASAVPAGGNLLESFQRLRRELAVTRNVALKLSPMRRLPVLVGFIHPVVLLPAEPPADAAEGEAILRHELAHLRRRDDWANLAQRLIQAILFFHPAIWWVSRQLSLEREIACDDFVLQRGGSVRAYALLLTNLASRIASSRPLLAPGVTTSKKELQQRINMILNPHRNTSPRLAKARLGFITSAAALFAVLALYAAPRLVLAQAAPPAPSADNAYAVEHAVAAVRAAPVIAEAPPGPPDAPTPDPPEAGTPPASTPSTVEPGPKAKPGDALSRNAPPRALVPVSTPAPAEMALPPAHPPHTPAAPQPPALVRPGKSLNVSAGDSLIEKRLRRLEELVQLLLRDNDPKLASRDLQFSFNRGPDAELLIDEQKTKHLQDMAERQAARAAEQIERANRELEKSMKLQDERNMNAKLRADSAQKQLEALQKQRQMLQREMEKLQGQMERIEREQEKLQENQQQRSELLEEPGLEPELMGLVPELGDDQPEETSALVN